MTSMQLNSVSFEEFVGRVEPRLRHALVAATGRERGREATAEALAYGWEHWGEVQGMANPVGYLYRVGRSRIRVRRHRIEFDPAAMYGVAVAGSSRIPETEPGLPDALAQLSERQRVAVFLICGMDWTRRDVADLLGISVSSVGSHLDRGLCKLRKRLGVSINE
jgi:DNA-directed RNA polymerase specialized sigma24 family protein